MAEYISSARDHVWTDFSASVTWSERESWGLGLHKNAWQMSRPFLEFSSVSLYKVGSDKSIPKIG